MPTAQRDRPAYEAHEPKFLANLRRQAAGGGFEERDRPRASRRIVTRVEDEEDGPTYVDEESNRIVSKAEYEALVAGDGLESQSAQSDVTDSALKPGELPDGAKRKQDVPQSGSNQRKRKAVKVGAGEEDDDEPKSSDDHKAKPQKSSNPQKKPKKKIKPIGLSFDHES